jgi:hypothetical protein
VLFTIREEPQVTQAVQSAVKIYPRVWEAFEALCWFIARRHRAEVSIATTGGLYYLHKQARGGLGGTGDDGDLHCFRASHRNPCH